MKKQNKVFDLRTVNPSGRLDVLAANAIEYFAQARVPELAPIVEERREAIHMSLNELCGPHALGVDLKGLIEQAQPYVPLLGMIAGQVVARYNAAQLEKEQQSGGNKAA